MGTWGLGSFDNDMACDWAYELKKTSDLSVIEKAINAVFEDDFIDSDVASEAIAAIETIAKMKGHAGVQNSYTEAVDVWVTKNKLVIPVALQEKAKQALALILGDSSELYELWAETKDLDTWKAEIKLLEEKIG